ncbi:NAD(P)-dependent dehydrogenase (short-subunit alcohol dehydrogenase family) [Rhodovulum imhoffii]|uniref:NAD(P)-dependent dehydrogenase (Short-subunit alcohol dehydrogenase family) n=1 Tax=Rhodovulum imhoffii TaxID=365340 RepID=A0A2T5BTY9_9RHOB|nr:SDR family oxidoreductase [Rhodovulum imhoffii]MBK5932732.1 short-chain dehydrogenase [Rhodovulum imhoffii]PTN02938.1 NAD(P)-dependent dehydrogenase (short-subunit alcohol dehydrogenase family) [Rhodovulum imhoffii]
MTVSGTAVLTGGGGILGRAMVERLSADGWEVAVVDRNEDLAHSAAAKGQGPGRAVAYGCDITDRAALRDLHARIRDDLGPVDALLCNAAAKSDNFFAPFESFPLEDWNEVMGVNLTAPMLCAQEFGAPMAQRGKGAIVNTLSIYGIVAPDQRIYEGSLYEGRAINTPAIYSASKAGLWGLTKYLASYWGAQGVRVNAVTPGGIFSGQNDTFVGKYSARTMMGRMGEPHEIADAVAFLVSDRASYVTGQNLIVDGGLSAW